MTNVPTMAVELSKIDFTRSPRTYRQHKQKADIQVQQKRQKSIFNYPVFRKLKGAAGLPQNATQNWDRITFQFNSLLE